MFATKKPENEKLFTNSVNGDDKTTCSAYIQFVAKVMNKKTGKEASPNDFHLGFVLRGKQAAAFFSTFPLVAVCQVRRG